MNTDARSTARRTTPMLAPPPPPRTSGREVLLAVAIGIVFVAGTTMAMVGCPSFRFASETGTPSQTGTARATAAAQSSQMPAPAHRAASVREIAAPTQAPKGIDKSKATPVATNTSSAAGAPSATTPLAPMVGPPAPDRIAAERTTHTSAVAAPAGQAVTISGCLEMTVDEDQFRLTDTQGADAPKARSWKSGFLKKGSAPVELIEFSDTPLLRKYVGHRVVATGLLTGRQLHVRSIQAGASSCE